MKRLIPYTENIAIAPATRQANKLCCNCSIPLSKPNRNQMCHVCWSMLEAVASPYWHDLQAVWNMHNDLLCYTKRMLLDPDYGLGEGENEDNHSDA